MGRVDEGLSVVPQSFWDSLYERTTLGYNPKKLFFKELFQNYLKPGNTCLEIGCYPGNYLIYLARTFGYTVSGIDLTKSMFPALPRHLEENGVTVSRLYNQDFMDFEDTETYDLVYSIGFIEHFRNYEELIEKHIRLVRNGGTLFIATPNFAGLQFPLHYVFDKENLDRHVVEAMDLRKWRRVLAKNEMRIVFHGYYRTAGFWTGSSTQSRLTSRIIRLIAALAELVDKHVDFPNRLTSPFLVSISEKSS